MNLGNNLLEDLPAELSELVNLKKLHLFSNSIRTLSPPVLCKYTIVNLNCHVHAQFAKHWIKVNDLVLVLLQLTIVSFFMLFQCISGEYINYQIVVARAYGII